MHVNPTLMTAQRLQELGNNSRSEKLVLFSTALSCILLAKLTYDAFTFADRERLREFDRRSMGPEDRRR